MNRPHGFLLSQLEKASNYIAHHIDMDSPRNDEGQTKREHLEYVKKVSSGDDIDPLLLVHVEIPAGFKKAFRVFSELASTRSELNPITFTELNSYLSVSGTELTPLEVKAINTFDQSWVTSQYKLQAEKNKQQ